MDTTVVYILFGSFLGLLLLGAPITVSLGVSALFAFMYVGDNPIKLVQIAFTSVGSFPLMALPAFILAGALMELGYKPHLPLASAEEEGRQAEKRDSMKRLGVAGLGMMQVMMYAVGLYAGDYFGIAESERSFLEWVSLLVTLPVLLYSGRIFFEGAWRSIRAGRPGMDVPVALAISLAFLASCYNFFQGQGEVWFDSVVMFIFFLRFETNISRTFIALFLSYDLLLLIVCRASAGAGRA